MCFFLLIIQDWLFFLILIVFFSKVRYCILAVLTSACCSRLHDFQEREKDALQAQKQKTAKDGKLWVGGREGGILTPLFGPNHL